jgi:hypothetical protein
MEGPAEVRSGRFDGAQAPEDLIANYANERELCELFRNRKRLHEQEPTKVCSTAHAVRVIRIIRVIRDQVSKRRDGIVANQEQIPRCARDENSLPPARRRGSTPTRIDLRQQLLHRCIELHILARVALA